MLVHSRKLWPIPPGALDAALHRAIAVHVTSSSGFQRDPIDTAQHWGHFVVFPEGPLEPESYRRSTYH
jgi:hypothetical protein